MNPSRQRQSTLQIYTAKQSISLPKKPVASTAVKRNDTASATEPAKAATITASTPLPRTSSQTSKDRASVATHPHPTIFSATLTREVLRHNRTIPATPPAHVLSRSRLLVADQSAGIGGLERSKPLHRPSLSRNLQAQPLPQPPPRTSSHTRIRSKTYPHTPSQTPSQTHLQTHAQTPSQTHPHESSHKPSCADSAISSRTSHAYSHSALAQTFTVNPASIGSSSHTQSKKKLKRPLSHTLTISNNWSNSSGTSAPGSGNNPNSKNPGNSAISKRSFFPDSVLSGNPTSVTPHNQLRTRAPTPSENVIQNGPFNSHVTHTSNTTYTEHPQGSTPRRFLATGTVIDGASTHGGATHGTPPPNTASSGSKDGGRGTFSKALRFPYNYKEGHCDGDVDTAGGKRVDRRRGSLEGQRTDMEEAKYTGERRMRQGEGGQTDVEERDTDIKKQDGKERAAKERCEVNNRSGKMESGNLGNPAESSGFLKENARPSGKTSTGKMGEKNPAISRRVPLSSSRDNVKTFGTTIGSITLTAQPKVMRGGGGRRRAHSDANGTGDGDYKRDFDAAGHAVGSSDGNETYCDQGSSGTGDFLHHTSDRACGSNGDDIGVHTSEMNSGYSDNGDVDGEAEMLQRAKKGVYIQAEMEELGEDRGKEEVSSAGGADMAGGRREPADEIGDEGCEDEAGAEEGWYSPHDLRRALHDSLWSHKHTGAISSSSEFPKNPRNQASQEIQELPPGIQQKNPPRRSHLHPYRRFPDLHSLFETPRNIVNSAPGNKMPSSGSTQEVPIPEFWNADSFPPRRGNAPIMSPRYPNNPSGTSSTSEFLIFRNSGNFPSPRGDSPHEAHANPSESRHDSTPASPPPMRTPTHRTPPHAQHTHTPGTRTQTTRIQTAMPSSARMGRAAMLSPIPLGEAWMSQEGESPLMPLSPAAPSEHQESALASTAEACLGHDSIAPGVAVKGAGDGQDGGHVCHDGGDQSSNHNNTISSSPCPSPQRSHCRPNHGTTPPALTGLHPTPSRTSRCSPSSRPRNNDPLPLPYADSLTLGPLAASTNTPSLACPAQVSTSFPHTTFSPTTSLSYPAPSTSCHSHSTQLLPSISSPAQSPSITSDFVLSRPRPRLVPSSLQTLSTAATNAYHGDYEVTASNTDTAASGSTSTSTAGVTAEAATMTPSTGESYAGSVQDHDIPHRQYRRSKADTNHSYGKTSMHERYTTTQKGRWRRKFAHFISSLTQRRVCLQSRPLPRVKPISAPALHLHTTTTPTFTSRITDSPNSAHSKACRRLWWLKIGERGWGYAFRCVLMVAMFMQWWREWEIVHSQNGKMNERVPNSREEEKNSDIGLPENNISGKYTISPNRNLHPHRYPRNSTETHPSRIPTPLSRNFSLQNTLSLPDSLSFPRYLSSSLTHMHALPSSSLPLHRYSSTSPGPHWQYSPQSSRNTGLENIEDGHATGLGMAKTEQEAILRATKGEESKCQGDGQLEEEVENDNREEQHRKKEIVACTAGERCQEVKKEEIVGDVKEQRHNLERHHLQRFRSFIPTQHNPTTTPINNTGTPITDINSTDTLPNDVHFASRNPTEGTNSEHQRTAQKSGANINATAGGDTDTTNEAITITNTSASTGVPQNPMPVETTKKPPVTVDFWGRSASTGMLTDAADDNDNHFTIFRAMSITFPSMAATASTSGVLYNDKGTMDDNCTPCDDNSDKFGNNCNEDDDKNDHNCNSQNGNAHPPHQYRYNTSTNNTKNEHSETTSHYRFNCRQNDNRSSTSPSDNHNNPNINIANTGIGTNMPCSPSRTPGLSVCDSNIRRSPSPAWHWHKQPSVHNIATQGLHDDNCNNIRDDRHDDNCGDCIPTPQPSTITVPIPITHPPCSSRIPFVPAVFRTPSATPSPTSSTCMPSSHVIAHDLAATITSTIITTNTSNTNNITSAGTNNITSNTDPAITRKVPSDADKVMVITKTTTDVTRTHNGIGKNTARTNVDRKIWKPCPPAYSSPTTMVGHGSDDTIPETNDGDDDNEEDNINENKENNGDVNEQGARGDVKSGCGEDNTSFIHQRTATAHRSIDEPKTSRSIMCVGEEKNEDVCVEEREEWQEERQLRQNDEDPWDRERQAWYNERKHWEMDRQQWDIEKREWTIYQQQWEMERRQWMDELSALRVKVSDMERLQRELMEKSGKWNEDADIDTGLRTGAISDITENVNAATYPAADLPILGKGEFATEIRSATQRALSQSNTAMLQSQEALDIAKAIQEEVTLVLQMLTVEGSTGWSKRAVGASGVSRGEMQRLGDECVRSDVYDAMIRDIYEKYEKKENK